MTIQGTQEWLQERVGLATASRFKDIIAKIKTGESASRRNYRLQLAVERLTNLPATQFVNGAMEWGSLHEPEAKQVYQKMSGNNVIETGFHQHFELQAGASPDGFVGDDGLIEIKCPYVSANHIETLMDGMPSEHKAQVQGGLWITGRKWCDFISYDPRMPEHLKMCVQRIERDNEYIDKLQEEVVDFLIEVERLTVDLMNRGKK